MTQGEVSFDAWPRLGWTTGTDGQDTSWPIVVEQPVVETKRIAGVSDGELSLIDLLKQRTDESTLVVDGTFDDATAGGSPLAESPAFLGALSAPPWQSEIVPQANTAYDCKIRWNGRQQKLKLSMDVETAAYMKERGNKIRPDGGCLVYPDGEAVPLLPQDPSTTGIPAELRNTAVHISSLGRNPDGTLKTDTQISDELDPDVLRFADEPSSGVKPPIVALDPDTPMTTHRVVPGFEVTGTTKEAVDSVLPVVKQILGDRIRQWPQVREQRLPILKEAMRIQEAFNKAAETSDMDALQKANEKGMRFLGLPPHTQWDPTYKALLNVCAMPYDIKVVVVPSGLHPKSMPQWPEGLDVPKDQEEGSLGINMVPLDSHGEDGDLPTRLVFVPEDDLKTQRHELRHTLQDEFLTPEEKATIDRAYDLAVANKGPFARTYGTLRKEFFTTWGEVYDEGGRGQAFVRRYLPSVAELLQA
jgi:hypothetical protein